MNAMLTGLRAWTLQRLTALYVLAFIAFVLSRCLIAPPQSFYLWQAWWRSPPLIAAGLLFVAALCIHAWVGGRDVILDYVRPPALRATALAVLALGLAALAGGFVLTLLAP